MRKGLFWVIGEANERQLLTYTAECDGNGVLLEGQPPYNSRNGDSYAHKNSWELAAKDYPREIRNKPWNHFPRGRVEIKDGKVIVFHVLSAKLHGWAFKAAVLHSFGIENIPVRFVPDGSKHYRFLEDDYA